MKELRIPGIANLKNPVDDELNFGRDHEVMERESIDRIVKIAVGFGANNAAIAFEKIKLWNEQYEWGKWHLQRSNIIFKFL